MATIQRNITVPNERLAMGLDGGTPTQDSINQCILDIHSCFNDCGLTPIQLDGDLDDPTFTLPDMDLPRLSKIAPVNPGEFHPMAHKTYAFNDDRQEQDPIYISLRYGLFNATSGTTAAHNTYLFMVKLKVSRTVDMTSLIFDEVSLSNISYSTNADRSSYANSRYSIHNNNLSLVCFTNNRLYVNILPNSKSVGNKYNTTYFNTFKYGPYVSFYLERVDDVINLYRLCVGVNNSETSLITNQHVQIQNYRNNFELLQTNEVIKIPFMGVIEPIRNVYSDLEGNPLVFRSTLVDKGTNVIKPNPNVLCAYTAQIGKSNVKYEIDVGDGIKYKYLSYSTADTNIVFSNAKTDLLFRYE